VDVDTGRHSEGGMKKEDVWA